MAASTSVMARSARFLTRATQLGDGRLCLASLESITSQFYLPEVNGTETQRALLADEVNDYRFYGIEAPIKFARTQQQKEIFLTCHNLDFDMVNFKRGSMRIVRLPKSCFSVTQVQAVGQSLGRLIRRHPLPIPQSIDYRTWDNTTFGAVGTGIWPMMISEAIIQSLASAAGKISIGTLRYEEKLLHHQLLGGIMTITPVCFNDEGMQISPDLRVNIARFEVSEVASIQPCFAVGESGHPHRGNTHQVQIEKAFAVGRLVLVALFNRRVSSNYNQLVATLLEKYCDEVDICDNCGRRTRKSIQLYP